MKLQYKFIIHSPLNKLVAVQEQYPNLKSDTNYQKLMEELTQVEDEIANSRKFYNALVKKYNTHITIFPNNIYVSFYIFFY